MDMLLRRVRPLGGAETDILIRGGRIARVAPGQSPGDGMGEGVAVEEGGGALALPALVEAHTHLDKTLWGLGWMPHGAGPGLIDKIENERRLRRELNLDPALQSARQVVQCLRKGTTLIRTHVDVDTVTGVAGIEGVMETRARYAGAVAIQIVAFPQSGLLVRPGTMALMEDAMRLGADLVGGLDPCGIDRDPKGHLDAVFGLAERFGKPIDIHLHEAGLLGAFSLELIFERIRALSMQGKVTISHGFCLGDPDAAMVAKLLEEMVELRVGVITTGSPSRPVPSVAQLHALGIRIAGGSDGIRDSWNPYGQGDMLERAMLIGLRNNFRRDPDIELALATCSTLGAAALDAGPWGLAEGDPADIVLVAAETAAEAVVSQPVRQLVLHRGRPVARNGEALVEAPG